LAFFWLGFKDLNFTVLALAASLLGGLLGFLKYNAFPAKIFMGDTGSQLAGFVLGAIAIVLTQTPYGTVSPVVPLMVLSVPITDTLIVMLTRVLRGKNPLSADMTHLHHKILSLGLGHDLTVLLICGLSLLWTLAALAFRNSEDYYLFGGLLLGTLLVHMSLNALLMNEHSLQRACSQFLGRLSIFRLQNLSTQLDKSISLIMVGCLGLYFLASLLVGKGLSVPGFVILGAGGMFGSIVLLFVEKYQKLLCYILLLAPVVLINFQVERWGGDVFWQSVSLAQMTNVIFVILSLLMAVKFVLQKSVDSVLDFSLEFILFAMGLTLAVVSPDIDVTYHLSGIISKGIVVFLAVRFLTIGSQKKLLLASILLNLSLLVIVLK
jgi:UDP-GlcNAc:undecaprenyl-phosphate GlcNAc-1-phosphate transferase